jgi:hypothetical protein
MSTPLEAPLITLFSISHPLERGGEIVLGQGMLALNEHAQFSYQPAEARKNSVLINL